MDEIVPKSKTDTSHLIPPQLLSHRVEDIKYRPQPRYETAGGRASRMIIESSSYQTTPCNSPPNEIRDPIHASVEPATGVNNTSTSGRPGQENYQDHVTQVANKASSGGETISTDTGPCNPELKQTPRQIKAITKDGKCAESRLKGSKSSSVDEIESNPPTS
jgi:hypothetical protein